MPSIARQLQQAAVTHTLKAASLPAEFSKLPLSAGTGSWSATEGWSAAAYTAYEPTGAKSGIYYNVAALSGDQAFTMLGRNNDFEHSGSRQFHVWLFADISSETPNGYQLVALQTGVKDSYTFILRKFVAGVVTTFETVEKVSMEKTGAFAIVKLDGKVTAWVLKNSSASWTCVGSTHGDRSFNSGYSAISGDGSNPKLVNFATGVLIADTHEDDRPALGLSVEIETPHGNFRLSPGDPDPAMRPSDIHFSTQRGDGFTTGGCTVFRSIFKNYPDINLLDTWRFIGEQGNIVYEGRLHSNPRTNDPRQQITIELVGWMTYLGSKKIPFLGIDSRLSSWGEPSVQRKANLRAAGIHPDPAVSTGWQLGFGEGEKEAKPGVVMAFGGVNRTVKESYRGESWFYGGGQNLGKVLAHFHVLDAFEKDAGWSEYIHLSTDDVSTEQTGTNHSSTTDPTPYETLTADGKNDYKYAALVSDYNGAVIGTLSNTHVWEFPKVVGDHNLEVKGLWPEVGFSISDLMQYIVETYYPKVTWAGDDNDFPVSQCAYHDNPQTGYQIFQDLNNLALWATSMWEERKLYFYSEDLSRYDWQFRTDDPGVTVNFQGDSIENFANGVMVTYTDFAGVVQILLPSDHEELRDESDNNPANIHEEDLWADCIVPSPCSEAEALQYGRIYLAEYNRPKRPGSYSIEGHIRDGAGNWRQGWAPRSSQTIGIIDDLDDAPRLIFATNWDASTQKLDITVDAPPKYLDAIVARQELARQARGLS